MTLNRRLAFFAILGYSLSACTHTPIAKSSDGSKRKPAAARLATCTGTIEDSGAGTLSSESVTFAIQIDENKVTINDQFVATINYANFDKEVQNLTLITAGDGSETPPHTWTDRMKRFPITFKLGANEPGFYIGDGDFHWGGKFKCDDWHQAIPNNNFGD